MTGQITDIMAFDGTRRTTRNSAVPIRSEAGATVGAVLVQEDITETRADQARQRLLAAALDGLQEGVGLLRADGEYLYTNEAYRRILGIRNPDALPGRLQDTVPEALVGFYEERLREAAEGGRWVGHVRRPRLDDGQEVTLDVVLGRVDRQAGRADLLFGIVRDVSEEIRREQHLRRAERLASVGTLVGGVAHELNNPLTAVLNFAQLLMMDEREPADQEALAIIVRESERMARIVANLKQIAQSTQEEVRERGPVDLNEVVHHVLKVQEYRLRTGNIEVRLDLADDLPPILADRGQMEQVLLNLVVNAKQAMVAHRGQGRLVVRTRPSAKGVALHVVDDGPGIPTDHLERIWDSFYTTKPPGEGTGLGLPLVHGIVAEHGGEIRVVSQAGSGATFRVDLPRAGETSAAPEPVHGESPAARPLRVLVVDDEAPIRVAAARYLARRGHRVDQASEGTAALEMVETTEYDVILSDLRMPGLGGEAMLERLRERGLADRVVFLTGDASGFAGRLVEAGVPVLLKPIGLQELSRAVEGVARRPSETG